VQKTDRRDLTVTYAYDALMRLAGKTWSGGSNVFTFTYRGEAATKEKTLAARLWGGQDGTVARVRRFPPCLPSLRTMPSRPSTPSTSTACSLALTA